MHADVKNPVVTRLRRIEGQVRGVAAMVEDVYFRAGEVVSAGQPLASILNAGVVWVESDVFEKDLPRIRVGQAVTIIADAVPGREFLGRISYIGGEVNVESRAVRIRTVVNNPGEVLKPNMFARRSSSVRCDAPGR